MATEKILLEVQVSAKDATQRAAELKREIIDTERELNKLNESVKGNAGAQKAAAEKIAILTAELRSQKKEYNDNIKEITNISKVNELATGSIDQMRAALAVLTERYNGLSQAERESEETQKGLVATTKMLSDKLKEQEGAIGDTRRNVGNYTEAFKEALQGVQLFGVDIGKTAEGMKGANNAFKLAGGGVKGFSAAMLTTGIPLVVEGVKLLIGYFSQFKPVVDQVERAIAFLTAGFKALISGTGGFFEAGKAASELTSRLQDLEDAENGLNIARAEGESKVKQLLIAAKDRTKSAKEQIDLINEASKVEQELFDKESANAKERAAIAEQQFMLKKGISQRELDAIIDQTTEENKAIAQAVEKRITYDDEEVKKFAENRIKIAEIAGQSAELREKIANRLAAAIEKNEQEIQKAEQEAAEKRKKSEEDRLARIQDQAAKEIQIRELLAKQFSSELDKNIELEKIALEESLNNVKGNGQKENELRVLLRQQAERKIQQLIADTKAAEQQKAEQELELLKQSMDAKMAASSQLYNEEISLINQRLEVDELRSENEIKNEEELNKKKLQLKIAALEEELKLTIQYLGADGVITQAEALGIAKIQELITGLKQQLIPNEEEPTLAQSLGLTEEDVEKATEVIGQIQQGLAALQSIINAGYEEKLNKIDATTNAEIAAVNASTLSEKDKKKKISEIEKKAAKEKYEIEKKQFETNKTFQIINAVIAGALAIVQSFSQLGPIAGAIAAVLIGATTIAQVATISSQQPPAAPSFMEGGYTEKGNPNEVATNLGIKDYVYHKSEYVAPAHVLATPEGSYHVAELEKIRQAKKSGRRYLGGMADGGFAIRSATGETSQTQQMIDGILAGVQELPAPIVRVTEINRVNQEVNEVVVSSELR